MIYFDKFEDTVTEFILGNVYYDGEELSWKRSFRDKLKLLYEEIGENKCIQQKNK